jgi:hypothetical protein
MTLNIECEWGKENTVVINPDGQVVPCCYYANNMFLYQNKPVDNPNYIKLHPYDEIEDQLYHLNRVSYNYGQDLLGREYSKYKDELNIFNYSMQEILNHKWYTEILPKSWLSEKTCTVICARNCNNV